MDQVTTNNLIGASSPAYLSKALNCFAHHIPATTIADAEVGLGTIKAPVTSDVATLDYWTSAGLSDDVTDETVALTLNVIGSDGALAPIADAITLNPANTTARHVTRSVALTRRPVAGEIVVLEIDYTAGSDPADPALSLTLQFS